jgi:hypothetical protein
VKPKPIKCEGCGSRFSPDQLRHTSGGRICAECHKTWWRDTMPEGPPTRQDIPPQGRMMNIPSGHSGLFWTLLIGRTRRRA